jgi:hypothetical protein
VVPFELVAFVEDSRPLGLDFGRLPLAAVVAATASAARRGHARSWLALSTLDEANRGLLPETMSHFSSGSLVRRAMRLGLISCRLPWSAIGGEKGAVAVMAAERGIFDWGAEIVVGSAPDGFEAVLARLGHPADLCKVIWWNLSRYGTASPAKKAEVVRLLSLCFRMNEFCPGNALLEQLLVEFESGRLRPSRGLTFGSAVVHLRRRGLNDPCARWAFSMATCRSEIELKRISFECAEAGCGRAMLYVASQLEAKGDFPGAEEWSRRAVASGVDVARERLGAILCSRCDFRGALEVLEGAEVGPGKGSACICLARAEAGLGNREEALRWLRKGKIWSGWWSEGADCVWKLIDGPRSIRQRFLCKRRASEAFWDSKSLPPLIRVLLEGDGCAVDVDEARAMWLLSLPLREFQRVR